MSITGELSRNQVTYGWHSEFALKIDDAANVWRCSSVPPRPLRTSATPLRSIPTCWQTTRPLPARSGSLPSPLWQVLQRRNQRPDFRFWCSAAGFQRHLAFVNAVDSTQGHCDRFRSSPYPRSSELLGWGAAASLYSISAAIDEYGKMTTFFQNQQAQRSRRWWRRLMPARTSCSKYQNSRNTSA